MATISETELQKRLRALEKANLQSGGTTTSAATIERVGDQYQYTSDHIYIAYASTISNDEAGIVPNQSDVTGFQYTPFDSSGALLSYRGIYKSKSVYASGDPTDYVWEDITTISGFAVSERYYTVSSVMLAFLGSPTVLKEGVAWVYLPSGSSTPSTAIYIAERFSIGGIASDWSITPIQNTGAFFIIANGTIVGRNKPILGSSEWVTDAVATVTAFTGRPYSTQRELGYGTVVTIEYDDGKLSGLFKKNGAADTWVSSGTFIDGDLMVDGTIRAPAIAAGAITASHLIIGSTGPVVPATIGAGSQDDLTTAQSTANSAVTDAAAAQTAADSKSQSHTGSQPSGLSSADNGDLWIDTTNGSNELYRYAHPSWVSVRDGSIADAMTVSDLQTEIQDAFTNNVTVIDGSNITTGTVNAAAVNVDGSIEILSNSGNIRSGISYSGDSFPENTESITTEGFWLGRDTGKGKFIVGSKDQHLQWDGSALSLKGKLLTGDNIISVDGGSVSTQSFRVATADINDNGYGEITGGYRGTGNIDGWVLGTSGSTEDLTYTFEYTVSASQIGKHFFPFVDGNPYYSLSDHDFSFSLIDPGTGLSFYEDQEDDGDRMYSDADSLATPAVPVDTTARYADDSIGRPAKVSGGSRYMYRATSIPYQKMGKSITFDTEQKVFFRIFVERATNNPGWETLEFQAYASGEEEYWSVSTDSSGVTHTFDNTYESIQNVQITPGANSTVCFTDLGNESVKIHSNAASTCHVRAIGY